VQQTRNSPDFPEQIYVQAVCSLQWGWLQLILRREALMMLWRCPLPVHLLPAVPCQVALPAVLRTEVEAPGTLAYCSVALFLVAQ